MKKVFISNLATKLGALAIKGKLSELANSINPDKFGGAPLLGVDGSFIICHGSSKAKAIKNAVRVAGEVAERDVVGHIRKSIEEEEVEQYDSES